MRDTSEPLKEIDPIWEDSNYHELKKSSEASNNRTICVCSRNRSSGFPVVSWSRNIMRLFFRGFSLLVLCVAAACQSFQPDGPAEISNPCGGITAGTFKNGKLNEWVTANCKDGQQYVGEFKDDMRDGQGINTWANGERYEGQFKEDMRHGYGVADWANGERYEGEFKKNQRHGYGKTTWPNGNVYEGEYRDNQINGIGILTFANGERYEGEFKDNKYHGRGVGFLSDGSTRFEGVWEADNLIRTEKVDLQSIFKRQAKKNTLPVQPGEEDLSESLIELKENLPRRAHQRNPKHLKLDVSHTTPTQDGNFTVSVNTNSDTASLKINGEEQGGSASGRYSINRVARAGSVTELKITATDVYGNAESVSVRVNRPLHDGAPVYAKLDPNRIKKRSATDSVALIIGIQNYKRVPKAEFASDDAIVFYDYAVRALGVKPENIKLLIDDKADEVDILSALKSWLPLKVNQSKTDVYVFYSGHGLPSNDGKSLYMLPYSADKEFIERTAISQQELMASLQSAKPKSVTLFFDACYSGQTRQGDNLLEGIKPLSVGILERTFPSNFSVFTAAAPDQIASASAALKHGLFSYYLMKGLEGDADINKDGSITAKELHDFIKQMVSRQSSGLNRLQEPQFVGDLDRAIVLR